MIINVPINEDRFVASDLRVSCVPVPRKHCGGKDFQSGDNHKVLEVYHSSVLRRTRTRDLKSENQIQKPGFMKRNNDTNQRPKQATFKIIHLVPKEGNTPEGGSTSAVDS